MGRQGSDTTDVGETATPSRLAVLSLVLGVLSLGLVLPGLLGLPLGVVSLFREPRRRRMAVGGIATSAAGLALGAVALALLLPGADLLRDASGAAVFEENGTRVARAFETYALMHGAYPAAESWTTTLAPLRPDLSRLLRAPDDARATMLVFNHDLGGVSPDALRAPDRTVLLFESGATGGDAGGRLDLADDPAFADGALVVFADGSPRFIPPAIARAELIWTP